MAHRRFFSAVGSGLLMLLAASTAYAAGPYAYLTHYWGNQVSIVDTSTGAVVATLDVGVEPGGVATTPERVYITNAGSANVSVIDTATNTLVGTIIVGGSPFGIAADLVNQRVWVANQADRTLSVIDIATSAVVGTVSVSAMPIGVAVHPAGTWVFVTTTQGMLEMVSTASLSVVHSLPVGTSIGGVAVSPDGNRAWVPFHQAGGRVAVIDTTVPKVDTTVAVPMFPYGVAVDPQGSRVYVASPPMGSVSVIDAGSSVEIARVNGMGLGLAGLTVHPTAPELWVADEGWMDQFVVDTATHQKRIVTLQDTATSFGSFIAAPAAPTCDDGLQAEVEQALAKVEGAMRRAFYRDFTVPGDTSLARVRRLGRGVNGLTRGHLTGVYQNLLRVRASGDAPEPQVCDENLEAAVEQMLANVEQALRGIDQRFRLPGSGTSRRLHHLADAVAGLERGRLQGLYWTLR